MLTKDALERGITEMMEAIHAGDAIKSGAYLVHGVQIINKVNKLEMYFYEINFFIKKK